MIMRHDQPTTPFDVEAEELTQQFWGTAKGWVSAEQPTTRRRPERPSRSGDDTTGSLRVIRDGFAAFRPQTSPNATGEIRRQRRHGAPGPASSPASSSEREATLGELAAGRSGVGGWFDDDPSDDDPIPVTPPDHRRSRDHDAHVDADVDVPLTPVQPLVDRLGLGAVDPLLVRAGLIALALILLVPVVLSLRPERDDSLPGDVVEAPEQVVAGAAPAPTDAPSVAAAPLTTDSGDSPAVVATTTLPSGSGEGAVAAVVDTTEAPAATMPSATADAPEASATLGGAEAAAVDVAAERVVPACPQTYTASPGDSWYRIADAAGVTPNELLAENTATTDTVILPGDDICLPAGAVMPSPPPTTAPAPSEQGPTTTEAAPATTQVPTTTQAPSTTVAPVANLSRTEVQELIRQTWPEDEVETALDIARRESNFVATADNGWCCVGVFQLYWSVHRSWLDDFGITQRSDLYDARKNIAAAYHMWQQSGWGPWGG